MKNSDNNIPPFIREVCSAVCAIVHANIDETRLFKQSRARKITRISPIKKQGFSDNGVIVEFNCGLIYIKIHVSARIGETSIYKNATNLQYKVMEDILFFTSYQAKKVDVIITDIHGM
jgi:uncharacterized alkaline shock family protein YloU